MTREERAAIKARCEAAVSGTWIVAEMTSHKSRKGGRKYYKVVEKAHTLDQVCHYIPTAGTADFIAYARQDIPALLDELDDVDKRNQHTIDCYIGEFEERKRAQADRDRWKSRAERAEEMLREYEPIERQAFIAEIDRWRARALALERAVKNTYDAPSTGCALCVHREERRVCYSGCRDKSLWQFNEARFSEPPKEGFGL